MFGASHLLAGLLFGKITGNYWLAVLVSVGIDFDHILHFFKSGSYKNLKKFYALATDESDPFGSPRTFLHNFFGLAVISGLAFLISFNVGFIVLISYLGHLFMDLIDSSDFKPFYPYGPVFNGPIKYFSKGEVAFDLILVIIFILI